MKKNGFFVAAGILSILGAVGMGIVTIVMILSSFAARHGAFDTPTNPELQLSQGAVVILFSILAVLFLIFTIVSIINAVVYLKNTNKTYDQLHENSGKIITIIVLSFLIGGVVCGVLGLLGYVLKTNEPLKTETGIEANIMSDELAKKLQQLKEMHDNNLISDEEYSKAREDVLRRI